MDDAAPRAPGRAAVSSSPPYVPVDGGAWRLSMGLRRLAPDQWLEVDGRRADELGRKLELLTTSTSTVLVTDPAGDRASRELLELVVAYLKAHHPGLVTVDGDTLLERTTGHRVDPGVLHPIAAASLLVQEDLCLLDRVGGTWRLVAACVCFPSRWSLTEKLGRSLDEIHGPVPGFHEELTVPATNFFDRLAVERPVWRLNWTVLDTPELHLASPSTRGEPWTAELALEALWFRVERQTLRRLEASGAIVFTIRSYVSRLDELVASIPGAAAALASTLRTVPAPVASYKGWEGLLAPLIDALAEPGAGPGDGALGHEAS